MRVSGASSPGSPSPARDVAVRVLHRVAHKGAYASVALDAELKRAGASGRDAALATEIVYGSLRVLPELDAWLAGAMDRKPRRLDARVEAVLRVAAYQLRHLERVPPRAVVHDAVAQARRDRGGRLGGFVNAVLRRLAAQRPATPERPHSTVLPAWLKQAVQRSLGRARAERFCASPPWPPPIGLRVQPRRIERDMLCERLRHHVPGAEVRPGVVSPWAVNVRYAGDPRRLWGYDQGYFAVQEEGAQAVALCVQAGRGERVLDACAGHGGKTSWLVDRVGSEGAVTATDLYEEKLARIGPELRRLGLENPHLETRAVDWSVGTGGIGGPFDAILVDAPCTGLGTVHRRPELLLRVVEADASRLAALQLAIVSRCASLLRPGGRLVYAVCSPLAEEGIEVVERLEAQHPKLRRMPSEGAGLPDCDADGLLRLGPWSAGVSDAVDGYQVAQWVSA